MRTQIIAALALIMAINACHQADCNLNDRSLTAETQTGSNTMSCLIDGKVWVANGNDHARGVDNCKFYRIAYTKYSTNSNLLHIASVTNHKCARQNGHIGITIDTAAYEIINNVKRYRLIADTASGRLDGGHYGDVGEGTTNNPRYPKTAYKATRPEHQGWVELTRNDTAAGVLSGRFEFYAEQIDDKGAFMGIRVHISQGRFDINYKKLPDCRGWI